MFKANHDHFPFYFLPQVFQGAVREACHDSGVPIPVAAGLSLSAAAVACQGHIRVRSPAGIQSPVSLFFLHVAKSGERKTGAEKYFLRGLRDFQTHHEKREAEHNSNFAGRLLVWKSVGFALRQAHTAAIRKGEDDVEEFEERMFAHAENEPRLAQSPKLFYADTTQEALLHGLATRWPSAVLQSSEASLILAGKASRNLAALNILWDGGEVDVDRRSGDSYTVRNAHLSASLMVQHGVIQKFLAKGSGHARDIGFLARCMICAPTSTQGERQIFSLEPKCTDSLDTFAQVTRELIRGYCSDDGVVCSEPIVLQFDANAARVWVDFYNWVEQGLKTLGMFSDISDFASKAPENVARVAAIFHAMEGKDGTLIDMQTTGCAIEVVKWYLFEFKRLLGEPNQLSEAFVNARQLEQWLQAKCLEHKSQQFSQSYVRTFGPNRLRDKKMLDGALMQLASEGKLSIQKFQKINWVVLNKMYFGDHPPPYLEPDPRNLIVPISYI